MWVLYRPRTIFTPFQRCVNATTTESMLETGIFRRFRVGGSASARGAPEAVRDQPALRCGPDQPRDEGICGSQMRCAFHDRRLVDHVRLGRFADAVHTDP